jgi:uncharacterized delta-60 repeat protein
MTCSTANRVRVEPLERRVLFAAGDLDTTFGIGGIATAPVATKDANVTDIASLPDGRFVVTGASSGNTLSVLRFRANGTLDPSFGVGGRAASILGGGAQALAVAVQPNLRTVVVGQRGDRWFILRYLANGLHDKTFGEGGLVTGRFGGGSSRATGVVIDSDGGIVIAGDSFGANGTRSVALARFDSRGSRDRSFGPPLTSVGSGAFFDRRNGETITKFSLLSSGPSDFRVNDLTQAADGSLFVTGSVSNDFPIGAQKTDVFVAQFSADGNPDKTFGGDGLIVRSFGSDTDSGSGIAIDSQGRPIVALGGIGTLAAARFTTSGHLDSSFGRNGIARALSLSGSATDVLIDSRGNIDLAGAIGTRPRVARLGITGALDQSFGANGVSDAVPFAATGSIARLAEGPDDTILAAGAGGRSGTTNARLFSIARLEA